MPARAGEARGEARPVCPLRSNASSVFRWISHGTRVLSALQLEWGKSVSLALGHVARVHLHWPLYCDDVYPVALAQHPVARGGADLFRQLNHGLSPARMNADAERPNHEMERTKESKKEELSRNGCVATAGLSIMNGATGRSDIEGKAARVAVSEYGQRVNFN